MSVTFSFVFCLLYINKYYYCFLGPNYCEQPRFYNVIINFVSGWLFTENVSCVLTSVL